MKMLTEFFRSDNSTVKNARSFTFQLGFTSSNFLRSLQSIQSDIRLMEVENEIPPNTISFSYIVLSEQKSVSITTLNPAELLNAFCRVSLITYEDKSRILSTLNVAEESLKSQVFSPPC